MKIIDLLNKIANGEEIPKKLKIDDWEYDEESEDLETELLDRLHCEDFSLNDEVEIIEPQEHKIPKKMSFLYKTEDDMQDANNKRFKNCINEIIDYLEEIE